MSATIESASSAIFAYTYGMDTKSWDLALSQFTDTVYIDYSAVSGPKAKLTKDSLRKYLQGLLDKEGLKVHTAISQVLPEPEDATLFLAYYSVRHYKTTQGTALKFALFGWYRYRLEESKISSLSIHVVAVEGDPSVLA